MKHINVIPVVWSAALFLLAGCGGGGGGAALPAEAASPGPVSLTGVVTEKNGETTDLQGIVLTLVESGAVATTDATGAFDFAAPPPGTLTLRVNDPTAPAAPAGVRKNGADDGATDPGAGADDGTPDQGSGDAPGTGGDDSGADDGGATENESETETEHGPEQETENEAENEAENENESEFEDGTDDREQASDDGLRVEGVQRGESVRIRLRLEDGRIVEARTSRSDGDEREIEIRMTRAATSDDPDLEGEVELEAREDREKFEVEVDHAAPGRVLDLFVVDPDGVSESQGLRTVDDLGHAGWELNTGDGQRLPHGVGSVDDLADHVVEVRDATAGTLLLTATLGELPTSAPPADDGSQGDDSADDGSRGDDGANDGSGDGGQADVRLRGRARLVASETGLEGYVEVRSKSEENRHRFKIEAEHLAAGRVVAFFVEDPGLPGSFLSLGRYAARADGEAEVELDTGDGDLLPGNVATAAALAGLAVEVRDAATDALLLQGTVPTPVLDD